MVQRFLQQHCTDVTCRKCWIFNVQLVKLQPKKHLLGSGLSEFKYIYRNIKSKIYNSWFIFNADFGVCTWALDNASSAAACWLERFVVAAATAAGYRFPKPECCIFSVHLENKNCLGSIFFTIVCIYWKSVSY